MTTSRVRVTEETVAAALREALGRTNRPRGNFFHDLRNSFRDALARELEASGVATRPDVSVGHPRYLSRGRVVRFGELRRPRPWRADLDFCAGYGHEDYSLEALCEPRGYSLLPSARPLREAAPFCIGNVLCCVANSDTQVEIGLHRGVTSVGYVQDISARKRKSYVVLFGIEVDAECVEHAIGKPRATCECPGVTLDEVALVAAGQYPPIYNLSSMRSLVRL